MEVDNNKDDVQMVSDDSNNEDESSDDENKESLYNSKKAELLERIRVDKTDYYAYVELIQILSHLGELLELREIRESFSREYPLTSEIWLAWIKDEQKIATTFEEKQFVKKLCERALDDYLSIDVWLEYIQFSIGLMSDGVPVENVRSLLEEALNVCGHDVAKGCLIWELFRTFENMILASLMVAQPNGENDSSDVKKQKRRIAEIFRRQLSVPLLEMENTYQELRSWLSAEGDDCKDILDLELLENNYKKALEKLSKILSFEERLINHKSDDTSDVYLEYLGFEKNLSDGSNDQFRIRCLYERAITDNPLNTDLWNDYLQYLADVFKVPEYTMKACSRAVRNCPSNAKFWQRLMILMEKSSKPKNEITELLNRALPALYSDAKGCRWLWLSYIYYLRRELAKISKERKEWEDGVEELRKVVQMGFNYLNKYFGSKGDYECSLLLWWARFEAETTHDLERFRLIWTDIMDSGHSKSTEYWLKYINLEWVYGDSKHLRKLCSRALAAVADSPGKIVTLWLEFESHHGSLDSFLSCQRICDEKIKQYKDRKKQEDSAKVKPVGKSGTKKSTEVTTKMSKNEKSENANSERKITGFKAKESPEKAKINTGEFVPHDPSKDERTVFISNLDFTVTEEQVTSVFENIGKMDQFRLVRDFKGRSKGYGYLVFSSKAEAAEALKLDRTPINQRPMFVSECDVDKSSRKGGLRFSKGIERNKLFVKGLPFSVNKAQLETLFSPYGPLKDVRVVTYRNGHSKGIAYVEYEDENSAKIALSKTDGLMVKDKIISVAVSDPPERKTEASLLSQKTDMTGVALGAIGKSDFGPRGRGRTQLSFLPRAVATTKPASNNVTEKMEVTESSATATTSKAMSNADFRAALLKK